MKVVEKKRETLQNNLNTVQKCLGEKDEHIINLENMIKGVEKNTNETILKLEKQNDDNLKNIEVLMEKISNYEKCTENKSVQK